MSRNGLVTDARYRALGARRICGPVTTLIVAACLLTPRPASAAPYFVYTGWLDFRFSHGQCLSRSAAAIRGAGLTEGFNARPQSNYAQSGDYNTVVRCIDEKKTVVFVVTGPEQNECVRLGEAIIEEFKKLGPNREDSPPVPGR
jgi:hypothetical protein